jgi:hypothetical protein
MTDRKTPGERIVDGIWLDFGELLDDEVIRTEVARRIDAALAEKGAGGADDAARSLRLKMTKAEVLRLRALHTLDGGGDLHGVVALCDALLRADDALVWISTHTGNPVVAGTAAAVSLDREDEQGNACATCGGVGFVDGAGMVPFNDQPCPDCTETT